jgi:polysaccharide biosynthesis/export protein
MGEKSMNLVAVAATVARPLFLAGICVLGAVACVSAPRSSADAGPPTNAAYRLAPPDVLDIVVRGVAPIQDSAGNTASSAIERQVAVRPDGKISFDLIGEVDAQGKTVAEVRTEIFTRLQEFIRAPDVTVILRESNSRRYYVLGEVNRIGAFPLVGEVTAVEALAQAGGPTILANVNGAWLSRPEGETKVVYKIKFEDITRGDGATNYALRPGDVVYVPPGFSARIGNALQVIFYPLQQIIGLGNGAGARVIRP